MHESVMQDSPEQSITRLTSTCAFYKGVLCKVEGMYAWKGNSNSSTYIIEYKNNREIVSGSCLDYRFCDLGNCKIGRSVFWTFYSPNRRTYNRGMPISNLRCRSGGKTSKVTDSIYAVLNIGIKYDKPGLPNMMSSSIFDADYAAHRVIAKRKKLNLYYKGIIVGVWNGSRCLFDGRISKYRPDITTKFMEYLS